jgi:hypothetical protein
VKKIQGRLEHRKVFHVKHEISATTRACGDHPRDTFGVVFAELLAR